MKKGKNMDWTANTSVPDWVYIPFAYTPCLSLLIQTASSASLHYRRDRALYGVVICCETYSGSLRGRFVVLV